MTDRDKLESELTAAILLLFQSWSGRSFDLAVFQSELAKSISPILELGYEASWRELESNLGIDLPDPTSATTSAQEWSSQYSVDLAESIANNTQKAFDSAKNVDDTASAFGEERANKIGITETTRAITAGQFGLATLAVGLGLIGEDDAKFIWVTADDELVCKQCGPLHEQPEAVWTTVAPFGPPLHPNCRCELHVRDNIFD